MAHSGPTSRLAQMQMMYQQKQQVERDQRKSEMIGGRSLAAIDLNDNKLTATLGAGKVRQMFDERRHQRTTGIDKSYPLQPIANMRKSPVPVNNSTKSTNGAAKRNESEFISNRANGNYIVSNKPTTSNSLDDERFPDESLNDDEIDKPRIRSTNGNNGGGLAPIKLPAVRKQLSGLSLKGINSTNSGTKLRPAISASRSSEQSIPVPELNQKPLNSLRPLKPTPVAGVNAVKKGVAPAMKPAIGIGSGGTKVEMQQNSRGNMVKRPSSSSTAPLPDNMSSCRICGRNFNSDRLEKHETICEKTAIKKRKIFDATIHRVKGTEAEQFVKRAIKQQQIQQRKAGGPVTIPQASVALAAATGTPSKKSDWRRKHEEFIAAIRSAKQVQVYLAKGGKLSDLPPPPPSENPDYVPCPTCGRRFNASAAERHIPKCVTFLHNKPKPTTKQTNTKRK